MLLTLPPPSPPLPGLQNDNDLQYTEDTKLESTESIDLYYIYFHKLLGESAIKVYRPTNRHAYAQINMHHLLRRRV